MERWRVTADVLRRRGREVVSPVSGDSIDVRDAKASWRVFITGAVLTPPPGTPIR